MLSPLLEALKQIKMQHGVFGIDLKFVRGLASQLSQFWHGRVLLKCIQWDQSGAANSQPPLLLMPFPPLGAVADSTALLKTLAAVSDRPQTTGGDI